VLEFNKKCVQNCPNRLYLTHWNIFRITLKYEIWYFEGLKIVGETGSEMTILSSCSSSERVAGV